MRQVDKLLAQVVQPVLGLAARPDPRDGGQVVCAHRGNRVVRPASRLRAFDPDEAVGKRTLLLELLAHDRLDKAEVLADHKRAGAATFVGEQGQQRRSGIADVRTLRCVHTVRNPEQPEQAHHGVEADARGVAPGGADRFDERHPLRMAELPRVERWQAPVLSVAEELIRRRADAHPWRDVVPPAPRVETVGGKSDGDVGDEADLVRGSRELPVGMELQPLVVRDAVWVETPDVLRPTPPGRAVYLAYRVERCEVAQRLTLAAHE